MILSEWWYGSKALNRVIKSIKMSLKLMLKLGLDQENVKKGLKMLLRWSKNYCLM